MTGTAASLAARKPILLLEPSSMVGGIVISTARQLEMPVVRQATSLRGGEQLLAQHDFGCAIVSLAQDGDVLALLHAVRAERYKASSSMPVAVITPQVSEDLARRLKALEVRRVLLQPFKVRELIATMEMLAA